MPEITRRGFLVGCSSAIAAMAGARFNSVVFGNPEDEPNQEILLTVFLRGGIDALNLIPPIGGADRGRYEAVRQEIAVPVSAALGLGTSNFGLHPAAAPLHELYANGNLALIQATGMHEDTRSHFDAMTYMEQGTPGQFTPSGWITRHLQSASNIPDEILMPALSVGHYSPQSLLASQESIGIDDPSRFNLNQGPWLWRNAQRHAMRQLYSSGVTPLHAAGVQTLNAADIIEANVAEGYVPAGGALYGDTEFGRHLTTVAQMIKLQLGLRCATVDLGGWDTHENQGDAGAGYFADLVGELSAGLHALFTDLSADGYADRLTVVVMSEFGRRFAENDDGGTDHGHGGAMMVLGGNVNGGLHGTWPGLHADNLYEGTDLAVTTDYRRVLSEILIRRMGNPHLGVVFPGYNSYAPLDIVSGVDLTPVYNFEATDSVFLPIMRR